MEELLLNSLKDNLNSLEKATIWIFVTLIIVVLASYREDDTLEIASFKMKKKYAGLIMYGMLVGLNFQVLKLFHNVNSIVQELYLSKNIEAIASAKLILNIHPWIFNPFSEYQTATSAIIDNLGYAFLIIIWWIGNAVAFKLMYLESRKVRLIGLVLAGFYLLFGLSSMALVQAIMFKVSSNPLRMTIAFAAIGVGAVIFFVLVIPLWQQLKKKTS